MLKAQVKVGEVYGVTREPVRATQHQDPYADAVPAKVVSLDAVYRKPHSFGDGFTESRGAIEVEFAKPVRSNYGKSFVLARKGNEHLGDAVTRHVFPPKYGARVIVAPWDKVVARREHAAQSEAAMNERIVQEVEEFEPVLAAYCERLASVGIKVEAHGDGSGLTGDVDVALYNARMPGETFQSRSTGFAYEGVRVPHELFNRLVEIAIKHGETVPTTQAD